MVGYGFLGDAATAKNISRSLLEPYDFLHGYCEDFACFLYQKYRWPIRKVYANDRLVHTFCVVPALSDLLVDIRGGTSDYAIFWDEFRGQLFGVGNRCDYSALKAERGAEDWVEKKLREGKESVAGKKVFAEAMRIDKDYPFWMIIDAAEQKAIERRRREQKTIDW